MSFSHDKYEFCFFQFGFMLDTYPVSGKYGNWVYGAVAFVGVKNREQIKWQQFPAWVDLKEERTTFREAR